MKYCPKCGNEIDSDSDFCPNCGSKITNNTNKKIPKKYIIIGIVVILIAIISFVSFYAITGDVSDIQYVFSSHKIEIQSVDCIQTSYVADDYNGTTKTYKVTFTPTENFNNLSAECYAYTENNTPIDTMANWMGLNPLNILLYEQSGNSNQVLTATVVFGQPGHTDFDVDYLVIFVYDNDKNGSLVSKFTYKV